MNGPKAFAEWTSNNIAADLKFGRKVYRYHPRSDEHSKKLCQLVLEDLLAACPALAKDAEAGIVVGSINAKYQFPNGKKKTLDLGLGTPLGGQQETFKSNGIRMGNIAKLRLACEAKQTMTEHKKSQPRLFDELSSSHEIVHQGDTNAIAAGIVVVNIADTFASPLRQLNGDGPLIVTKHRQPAVTESMVKHLGGVVMRDKVGDVGFDAFAVIVVNCDNVGTCCVHTGAPAPQPGDPHHYETFIKRISDAYSERFGQ